jgi:low density lipoprotein-related protein 2
MLVIPLTGLLLLLIAGAIFVFIRKRPFGKGAVLGSLTNSQSVSFRQGTNVEFGPTAFNNGPGGGEPLNVEYNMTDISGKNRDFSNPMYDALGNMESDAGSGIYEVPLDVTKTKGVVQEPASAILAPSSIIQKASPQIQRRHRELEPATTDTGKDTQMLVEETDD